VGETSSDIPARRSESAFGDLRGWIDALRAEGELREIDAEVDWDVEIGSIIRMAQGTGAAPALLFNNIKDYGAPDALSSRIFTGGQGSYSRLAMMFGLPGDTHPRELVKICRTIFNQRVESVVVKDGPVKQNILTGDDIDLLKFPVPKWNRLDGGRYILTYAGCVTKDPDTGTHNVGIYRGMVSGRDKIPVLLWRAQHWGEHYSKNAERGAEMPVAYVIGWEPSLGFTGGAPIQRGISEYDVMGAIRGVPVELVECETVPLMVPASAEIVIEGYISSDPETFTTEGPYAEFTGFYAPGDTKKHTTRVTCVTHRNEPIFRGTIEGTLPGSFTENAVMSSVQRTATAWNALEKAGVPGITDVWGAPIHAGINLNVQINQTYRNQAKQVAAALWGDSASHVRYKHVTVVDGDIDIHDYAAVDWAVAFRVNAGEDDVIIYPANWGAGLDPSTRKRDANVHQFGTGKWNRVLIDATINLDYQPDADGNRYPPSVRLSDEDSAAVRARWKELGLGEQPDINR
jgi:4-hydroxy-3-polyprenylbenzoate decarboxylase|tara:strand:- start:175 stop:1722 length:1548 start_codon:yes stop_codon:yes gene_type:complete